MAAVDLSKLDATLKDLFPPELVKRIAMANGSALEILLPKHWAVSFLEGLIEAQHPGTAPRVHFQGADGS